LRKQLSDEDDFAKRFLKDDPSLSNEETHFLFAHYQRVIGLKGHFLEEETPQK